jgi:hypothetical protein
LKPLSLRVLRLFEEMRKDRLDLHAHALFEAAGNESAEREGVLDAIDELTLAGTLDASGSDFYMLTEKGKGVIGQSWVAEITCPQRDLALTWEQHLWTF